MDLRLEEDARQWSALAMVRRPWRAEFFAVMVSAIQAASQGLPCRVLELGSGPGFLVEHLLKALPSVTVVALDFSAPMHRLAVQRLGMLAARVQFVERSFREPGWAQGLGQFEHVVTNQAVHELRHKHRAPALHAEVRACLAASGSYLVSDHYFGEGGMSNEQLYMSVLEQKTALADAGFASVEQLLLKGGMVLHRAT
jgi:SAM-dependent methyltransferase